MIEADVEAAKLSIVESTESTVASMSDGSIQKNTGAL